MLKGKEIINLDIILEHLPIFDVIWDSRPMFYFSCEVMVWLKWKLACTSKGG